MIKKLICWLIGHKEVYFVGHNGWICKKQTCGRCGGSLFQIVKTIDLTK